MTIKNGYAEKMLNRLAETKVTKVFIDGICTSAGCFDKPSVILIEPDGDDYQLCLKCYEKYKNAAQHRVHPTGGESTVSTVSTTNKTNPVNNLVLDPPTSG